MPQHPQRTQRPQQKQGGEGGSLADWLLPMVGAVGAAASPAIGRGLIVGNRLAGQRQEQRYEDWARQQEQQATQSTLSWVEQQKQANQKLTPRQRGLLDAATAAAKSNPSQAPYIQMRFAETLVEPKQPPTPEEVQAGVQRWKPILQGMSQALPPGVHVSLRDEELGMNIQATGQRPETPNPSIDELLETGEGLKRFATEYESNHPDMNVSYYIGEDGQYRIHMSKKPEGWDRPEEGMVSRETQWDEWQKTNAQIVHHMRMQDALRQRIAALRAGRAIETQEGKAALESELEELRTITAQLDGLWTYQSNLYVQLYGEPMPNDVRTVHTSTNPAVDAADATAGQAVRVAGARAERQSRWVYDEDTGQMVRVE